MNIGDIIQYKQEFLSGYSGINCPFADIADLRGEVVELRNRNIVRVRWDDGTESSARGNILDVIKPLPSFLDSRYQENLLEWRSLAIADIEPQIREHWKALNHDLSKMQRRKATI